MKTDNPIDQDSEELRTEEFGREGAEAEESIASAAGAAKKANRALKDTAQKYLDAVGIKIDLKDIEKSIHDRPFLYLPLAAGIGFVIGGGLATNMGVALLGLFGRKVAMETATNVGGQALRQAVAGARTAA